MHDTHQHNLNVTRVCHTCVDHELHMQFCWMPVTLCVVTSGPQTCENTHELQLHVYTFLYTVHEHVCIFNLFTELHYSLTKYLHHYKSTIHQHLHI